MRFIIHALISVFFSFSALHVVHASPGDVPEQEPSAPLSQSQLEKLVEPIALYPDLLLQEVLAASTFPEQILDAALFHEQGKDPQSIPQQPWDDSVKAIANYPSVLTMLASDLDWTITLASAFVNQSIELRKAIQTLRARAKTLGNLESNDQQNIIEERTAQGDEVIRIEPEQPEVVYVPSSTTVVYEEKVDNSDIWVPLASFGVGMALGYALGDDDDDHYYYGGGYYGPGFWHNDHCVDRWVDYRNDRWNDAYDFARDRQEWRQDNANDWREHRQDLQKKNADYRNERRKNVNTMSPEQRAQAKTRAQQSNFASNREGRAHTSGSSPDRSQANARIQQARSDPQVQKRASEYKSARSTTAQQQRASYQNTRQPSGSSPSRTHSNAARYGQGSSYSGMGSSRSSVNASRSRGYSSRGSFSGGASRGGGRSFGGGGRRR